MSEDGHIVVGDSEIEDDYVGSDVGSIWTDKEVDDNPIPFIECGLDCPLRRPYNPTPDPPLCLPPRALPLTRAEACSQLYSPIKEWQTRLLLVEPGDFGTEVSASLVVVDVVHLSGAVLHQEQQRIHYTALSYTWGAAVFSRSISINNVVCPITENLYAFIQRCRDTEVARYFWIDLICINQFDLDEKSTQVSSMLAIYERAESVLVWLGEEGVCTKLAADYLHWANSGEHLPKMAKHQNVQHSKDCTHLVDAVLGGIEDLCSRNWVRRIWVKQEVWAARQLSICCGTSQVTWNDYLHGLNVVVASMDQTTGNLVDELVPYPRSHRPKIPIEEASCLRNLRNRGEPSQLPDLLDLDEQDGHEILKLLNESIDCKTTNSHGRIYALLGMAGVHRPGEGVAPIHTSLIVGVDYSIPLEEVYRNLATSIMLFAGAYSILATDGLFRAMGEPAVFSWTPDFRHPIHCKLLTTFRIAPATTHAENYRLEDEKSIRRFRDLNPDSFSLILRLEGYWIATITGRRSIPPTWELYPIIYSRPYGGGKHAPITDYPSLKPMAVQRAA